MRKLLLTNTKTDGGADE